MVSARKQSRSYTPSRTSDIAHEQPSPLPFPDFGTAAGGSELGGSEDAASSLAEDEEFATEEHAHRQEALD